MTRNELYHHGILGMKWGVRRYQNPDGSYTAAGRKHYDIGPAEKATRSFKGNMHRAAAKVYDINAKTYKKSNKALSSMNAAERTKQLKLAEAADKAKYEKIATKLKAKQDKQLQLDRKIDPSIAKNKQTRRAAYDYHNLDDAQFRRKYAVDKKTFAKRYIKTNGDTYGMGLKKAAAASAINAAFGDREIHYVDLRTGQNKTIQNHGKNIAGRLAMDIAYSEAATRIGYDKAEVKYYENHQNGL